MDEFKAAEQHRLAEAVRQACIQTALDGYHDAALRGLCHEGAWEVAISAIRMLDLTAVLADLPDQEPSDP